MDICDLSAVELSAALRRRELSAGEALGAVLRRADEIAGTVNPFSARLDERARRAAAAADALLARGEGGPLCGVPVTTKDSHWMAGIESTAGSRTRVGFVPAETVGAIGRLEAAGAVVFARTTVPEFCYFGITESELFGRTSNPWNLDRTAGGSSGGAAAAVAAGCGPLSLGGDGGGSIRIPAAFCGVVGFKPTFGLVPHEPSSAGWKTLVALGPLARTVADARLMLTAVAGPDPRDRHSLPPVPLDAPAPRPDRLRLVVSEDLGFAPLDDDVRQAFRAAVTRLAAAGANIVRDAPGLGTSIHTWSAIALAEAYQSENEEFRHRQAELTEAAV
ncbi:MAG TPA: amidase, partial [Pilimelia sp.]|nr:amidase [Pilimelia sp.]